MEKGITLIALIITIVVLLILAVVAISNITNEGILGHATNAAKDYNQAQVNEGVMLQNYANRISEMLKEDEKEVTIQGMGGIIPNRKAYVNVRSAGTAARFLTVMLALAGGEYEMDASAQMCKRPMEPLLSILQGAGVEITLLFKKLCFVQLFLCGFLFGFFDEILCNLVCGIQLFHLLF